MSITLGATLEDWQHFDLVLGLTENLLPCVPASPDVKVLAGSALEGKVGKIPSQFNYEGEAHGLKGWQKRPIMANEIAAWSKDRRLNLCLRTGPISNVYAFDIDIDDVRADAIYNYISDTLDAPWHRARENSHKVLIPFLMETPCKKRKIKLDNKPKGPAIELLADGQQFVACGTHSSGVRYLWSPELPSSLPTITMDQLNPIWETLTKTYATSESARVNQTAKAPDGQMAPVSMTETSSASSTQTALASISESEWAELLNALRFLTDKVSDNDTWSKIGYALLSIQHTRPAKTLWIDFSKAAAGYEAGAPEAWWDAHRGQTPRSDYRSIFAIARQRGLANVSTADTFPPMAATSPGETGPGDATLPGGDTTPSPGGPDGPDGTDPGLVDVVPAAPSRPIIRIGGANYADIVYQLETTFEASVYTQGNHLVRQAPPHADPEVRRDSDALVLVQVTKEWMETESAVLVDWQKNTKDGWVSTDPGTRYVNALFNRGNWSHLKPLEALARSPFIRPDGSICDTPGYDRRSRVLYIPNADYPAVPVEPDHGAARDALQRIRDVFDEFPWEIPANESAFLSHILAEAARLAIDLCPVYFYNAPKAGTGKGILQEMAARIVHGTVPALRAWVNDGDEIRKALYAALLSGDRSLWFDNLPDGHKTRSDVLCAFATSSVWTDRKLGESSSLGVPNKMVVVASGNNITPTGDMARRSLIIRINANMEDTTQRVFRIKNPKKYVMAHRPELLVSALTIIRAYMQAVDNDKSIARGMPVPLQTFEDWSHYCRDPLIWLGMPNPTVTQKEEADDESIDAGVAFERLFERFGDRQFTGLDVARLANSIEDADGGIANTLLQSGCTEPNKPKEIGYWLRKYRDRIGHGIQLKYIKRDGSRGATWRLVRVGDPT